MEERSLPIIGKAIEILLSGSGAPGGSLGVESGVRAREDMNTFQNDVTSLKATLDELHALASAPSGAPSARVTAAVNHIVRNLAQNDLCADTRRLGSELSTTNVGSDSTAPAIKILSQNIQRRLSLAYERCNLRLPIFKLPPEIVTWVFQAILHDSDMYAQTLLSLSLVCRHWNCLVCGTPSLWCHIVLGWRGKGRYVLNALERSRNLPLTVDVGCHHILSSWSSKTRQSLLILEEMCNAMPRWRSIRLTFCTELTTEDVSPLLGTPSENLQEFRFTIGPISKVSLNLFGGQAPPSLKHLSVVGWLLTRGPEQFRNLETLELGCIDKNLTPSTPQFLQILQECTRLSSLHLWYTHVCRSWQSTSQTVELPALRQLTIHEDALSLLNLPPRIQFPNCWKLDVTLTDESQGWTRIASRALAPHTSTLLSILGRIESIRIYCGGGLIRISSASTSADSSGLFMYLSGFNAAQRERCMLWLSDLVQQLEHPPPIQLKLEGWKTKEEILWGVFHLKGVKSLDMNMGVQPTWLIVSRLGTAAPVDRNDESGDGGWSFYLPELEELRGGMDPENVRGMLRSRRRIEVRPPETNPTLPAPFKRIGFYHSNPWKEEDPKLVEELQQLMDGGELKID